MVFDKAIYDEVSISHLQNLGNVALVAERADEPRMRPVLLRQLKLPCRLRRQKRELDSFRHEDNVPQPQRQVERMVNTGRFHYRRSATSYRFILRSSTNADRVRHDVRHYELDQRLQK